MEVGYIRVSSAEQHTARQLDGVQLDKVFEDRASAGTMDRPGLRDCLEWVRAGDTLHVHSIDRLARNLADLLSLVQLLEGRGVPVRFHKEGLTFGGADGDGGGMGRLLLHILGAFAEFERSIILERQREGIEKARAEGRYGGRPRALSAVGEEEAIRRLRSGQSVRVVAAALGCSASTIQRVSRRHAG